MFVVYSYFVRCLFVVCSSLVRRVFAVRPYFATRLYVVCSNFDRIVFVACWLCFRGVFVVCALFVQGFRGMRVLLFVICPRCVSKCVRGALDMFLVFVCSVFVARSQCYRSVLTM